MKNFITHLKLLSIHVQGPPRPGGGGAYPGSGGFIRHTFGRDCKARSLTDAERVHFHGLALHGPGHRGVALLLSGLPFKAVDALALPAASSL